MRRQPGQGQRQHRRVRSRHSAYRQPGIDHGAHQPESRIRDQRRAGIADQREPLALHHLGDQSGDFAALIMVMQRNHPGLDPISAQQYRTRPGIFTQNGIDRA